MRAASPRRSFLLPRAVVAAAVLGLLPLSAGCFHIRTHDAAPAIDRPEALADHIAPRVPRSDFRAPRTVKVVVSYRPGPAQELTTGAEIGMILCPGWPYARGEWPLTELDKLEPVLTRLLDHHFKGDGARGTDYLLEVAFTPQTYLRMTRTVYGLSIFAGPLDILGIPTRYATIRLDADLRLHDVRSEGAAGGPVRECHATGIETADGGQLLWIFDINSLDKSAIRVGPAEVKWDDLFAEALADWFGSARGGLAQAFPRRCSACKLDYEGSVATCEKCGRALPPSPVAEDAPAGGGGPDDAVAATSPQRRSRGRASAAPRPDVEQLSPPR